MTYEIYTDSSCNLKEESIDELGLHILPLTFLIDNNEYIAYLKGQKTDLGQFYTMMREGKVITTSLPKMADSKAQLEETLQSGKDVLYLGFSSALSGTYEATKLICDSLAEKYPDRKVMCVETKAAALGEGMLVYHAAKMAQEGASIEEVAKWVEDNRSSACHWFTVDDLMFLFRGGRVSRTSAYAGTLLKIKPVLHVDDNGALIPMAKVKSRKKSIQALVDKMEELANDDVKDQTIFISHGDCLEEAEHLQELITERFGCTNFYVNLLDPV
ncbi:MAG: DegV family protein, partial [Anaerotardibacter sp.]